MSEVSEVTGDSASHRRAVAGDAAVTRVAAPVRLTDQSHRRQLVVIPAYNEVSTIASVVQRVLMMTNCDVLVVDDGSEDETDRVAAAAGARVLTLPFNLGVGGAVRAGFRYAAEHDYDTLVQLDADGQHDPADIPRLVSALSSADVIVGARFAGDGDYMVHGPRRWAMACLAFVVSRRAHRSLNDVTSGFRATNRRGIALFANHYPADYLSDTAESLMIALRAGLSVDQVPVTMTPRCGGVPSQSAPRAALHLCRTVMSIGLALVRQWPQSSEIPREA